MSPLHLHDKEQMVYVLKGRVRWLVAGQEMIVTEGEVLRVPSGVMHQAEALDDTFQIFHCVRSDLTGGSVNVIHVVSGARQITGAVPYSTAKDNCLLNESVCPNLGRYHRGRRQISCEGVRFSI